MKLSEALILGSTLGEKPTNLGGWDTCLLGVACHAIGTNGIDEYRGQNHWPWLALPVNHPRPELGHYHFGRMLLTDLCWKVTAGEMTIQQAAEIVREIEPEELEVGEARNEQADRGERPVRPTVEEIEA